MDFVEIVVLVSGLSGMLFVLWFFLGAREAVVAAENLGGVQEIEITVKGGYSPDFVQVEEGRPVRLVFKREESNPCTENVILGDFGVTAFLPQGLLVPVEFTPQKSGEFVFSCGMNMLRGKIRVKAR